MSVFKASIIQNAGIIAFNNKVNVKLIVRNEEKSSFDVINQFILLFYSLVVFSDFFYWQNSTKEKKGKLKWSFWIGRKFSKSDSKNVLHPRRLSNHFGFEPVITKYIFKQFLKMTEYILWNVIILSYRFTFHHLWTTSHTFAHIKLMSNCMRKRKEK